MKKSNKLLLGGFLTVILIITGIHIALYAKYKRGDYILYHRTEILTDSNFGPINNIKLVRIQNVFSANIRFGGATIIESGREGDLQVDQKGDSLFIRGKYFIEGQDNHRIQLNITLPYDATIVTDSISHVTLTRDLLKSKIIIVPNNP